MTSLFAALVACVAPIGLGACADAAVTDPVDGPREIDAPPSAAFGTLHEDQAASVAANGAGIWVVGHTQGALHGPALGDFDAFIRRYDHEGDLVWARQYGTALEEVASNVAASADGYAWVAGYAEGSLAGGRGGSDGYVRRYDPAGVALWTRQFGSTGEDFVHALAVGPGGVSAVVGHTLGDFGRSNLGNRDAYVRMLDANGGHLWTRQFGSVEDDLALGVAIGPDGYVYVGGYTCGEMVPGSSFGGCDAFLWKFSPAGERVWRRQFGTDTYDEISALIVDRAGDVVVAGETGGDLYALPAGSNDIFVARFRPNGKHVVGHQVGTVSYEDVREIAADSGTFYYVTGRTWGTFEGEPSGNEDVYVMKINRLGNRSWIRQYDSGGTDYSGGVATADNAVFIAGATLNTAFYGINQGYWDGFVMRLDRQGTRVWTDQ